MCARKPFMLRVTVLAAGPQSPVLSPRPVPAGAGLSVPPLPLLSMPLQHTAIGMRRGTRPVRVW